MRVRRERFASALAACVLGAGLLTPVAVAGPVQNAGQDPVPSLTTDDVMMAPAAVTKDYEARTTATAVAAATESKAAAKGYSRVTTARGYSFERPADWKAVENLVPKGAPSFFTIDAIFEDARTGAVATAISVDRSKLTSPIDVGNREAVNNLLGTMLASGDAKATIKILRREAGEVGESKLQWVRIKAQGSGQAQDGSVIPTTYWVQIAQTPDVLALVAVGYPSDQPDAGVSAYHIARTLEVTNVAGSEKGSPGESATRDAGAAAEGPAKKNSAGGVRQPQ
jgi:hypothetical protein